MKEPVVVIGLGEIGSVIARGYLHHGHPVFPVTRQSNIEEVALALPDPHAVIVAVGEKDLQSSITSIPEIWQDKLVFIQNELLPNDWKQNNIDNPTVASIWFEKKKGQDSKVVVPTIAYGALADSLKDSLASIDIPVTTVNTQEDLLFELVRKNLYILTSNIAGIKTGGTVGNLWKEHQAFAKDVAKDVLTIQKQLTGKSLDDKALLSAMLVAFDGDPEHNCMGRSAPDRLKRAIALSNQYELDTPTLHGIASSTS